MINNIEEIMILISLQILENYYFCWFYLLYYNMGNIITTAQGDLVTQNGISEIKDTAFAKIINDQLRSKEKGIKSIKLPKNVSY